MVIVSRAPTPTIEPQEVMRPRATPVDTYIRPPDPAPSDLHNLAAGLQNFSRDIKGMFAARAKRDEEAARIRGEAQFFRDNQVGYAEAVRQGKIPAFASRPFMESYKEAEGKVIGARLASQMQLEYQGWEGRNSQDPANFDQFMAEFLKRNLTTDDADILRGAMPYIYSTVNNGYSQRTQDAADAAYNGGLNANVAVSSMAIDDYSIQGLSNGRGTDYDALWDELIRNRSTALSSGIREADYDSKFIDAIAAKALEHRDPALLALLDKALPGAATPMSASPYGREVKAKTISAMETVNYQAENHAYTQEQRRDAALKEELTALAIDALTANPNAVLPDNFWAAYLKVEPEGRIKVEQWRNNIISGTQEDPAAIRDLNYRILVRQENPTEVIEEAMANGTIRSAQTLKTLYEMGQEEPVWQNSQAYDLGLKAIQQAAGMGGEFAFDPEYVSPAATAAALDFELSMRAWAQTPEGMSAIATNDMATIATVIAQKQKIITDGFVISQGAQAEYVQPEAVTEELEAAGFDPNPQARTEAQVMAEQAAAEELAASPQGQMPEWTQGTVPDLNTLPPEEQTAIRQEADRMGIDPQVLLEETYRQVDELIRGVDQQFEIENTIENAPVRVNPAPAAPKGNLTPMSGTSLETVIREGRSDPTYFALDPQGIVDETPRTSSNWNFGNLTNPNALVIHHTGGRGTVEGVVQTFKERGYPAHFVIDREGVIHRILREDQKGQHTRPAEDGSEINNSNSWGVEIIANDDSDLTPQQVRAALQLSQYLHKSYGLPLDRVVGHGNINGHKQESEGDTVLAALDQMFGNSASNDGDVEGLLAFISQEEGTAGDDPYNVVYGGATQPLTSMTLSEVQQIGKAAGRYQVLPGTLDDARQALGLSPDTKFTPEVQDQVALWLLERRGLARWKDGRMTDAEFIDALSQEWAALSGSDGKAHYPGQGQNASLERLVAALEPMKR